MSGQSYGLSKEQIQFYRENGYLQIHNLISPEEAEQIKQTMLKAIQKYDEIKARQGENFKFAKTLYGKVLDQRVNLWQADPEIKKVSLNNYFGEIARQLVGTSKIHLFHDQALLKPSGDMNETPWHQDRPYWPMNGEGALSIWIALDDVDENNGCMCFIPRSRNFGAVAEIDLEKPQDIFKALKAGQQVDAVKVMKMKKGSATFHDGLTFHYAFANKTSLPRHAMVMIYFPDGVGYSGKKHMVTDPLNLTLGEPLAGETFPVVAEGRVLLPVEEVLT